MKALLGFNDKPSRKLAYLLSAFLFAVTANLAIASSELDLSELSMYNATAFDQQIITGGQPMISDFKKFADNDVKLVINLRGEGEFEGFDEQQVVEGLGIKYVHIPVSGGAGISLENANKLAAALAEQDGKVVLHCASGNRVGALLAINAFQQGKLTEQEAIALGQKAGLSSLEEKTRAVIGDLK